MKLISKFAFLFIIFCAQSTLINAQLSIGARAGINTANVSAELGDTVTIDPESILATYYGVFGNYAANDLFSIQAELNYFQKGFKIDTGDDFIGDVKTKSRINYLEIPILAKLSFGSDEFKGFVNAGPSFSFALSGTNEVCTGGILCVNEDIDFDASGLKKTDLSFALGGGVEFNGGPGNLIIEIRYALGLSDINDGDLYDSLKTRAFSIGAGYVYYFN